MEAMHVHASKDSRLRETGAAKFFVLADGSSRMMAQGTLRDCDVAGSGIHQAASRRNVRQVV